MRYDLNRVKMISARRKTGRTPGKNRQGNHEQEETEMNHVMEERLKSESGNKHIKLPGNIEFLEREQEIER